MPIKNQKWLTQLQTAGNSDSRQIGGILKGQLPWCQNPVPSLIYWLI